MTEIAAYRRERKTKKDQPIDNLFSLEDKELGTLPKKMHGSAMKSKGRLPGIQEKLSSESNNKILDMQRTRHTSALKWKNGQNHNPTTREESDAQAGSPKSNNIAVERVKQLHWNPWDHQYGLCIEALHYNPEERDNEMDYFKNNRLNHK